MSLNIGPPRKDRMSNVTDSRGRHESMTSLENIPILLHLAEFVHLHGVGIFERAYTQSGINLLISRYPYHQELTVCRDQEPPSHTVSPGVIQVAPSVYGFHVLGSASERQPLQYAP